MRKRNIILKYLDTPSKIEKALKKAYKLGVRDYRLAYLKWLKMPSDEITDKFGLGYENFTRVAEDINPITFVKSVLESKRRFIVEYTPSYEEGFDIGAVAMWDAFKAMVNNDVDLTATLGTSNIERVFEDLSPQDFLEKMQNAMYSDDTSDKNTLPEL